MRLRAANRDRLWVTEFHRFRLALREVHSERAGVFGGVQGAQRFRETRRGAHRLPVQLDTKYTEHQAGVNGPSPLRQVTHNPENPPRSPPHRTHPARVGVGNW